MRQSVLVLNANYEPLNICTMKRAVGMMMTGRAVLLVNGREQIKTATSSYPRPSIVRLSHMVYRPRLRVRLTRREIFRRDGYICQYCGQHTHHPTIDHVVPKHYQGEHSWENLVTACASCNRRKGGRTPREAKMPLRKRPIEPKASARYMFGHLTDMPGEWESYLQGW